MILLSRFSLLLRIWIKCKSGANMSLYIIFSMNKSEYLNPTTGMWEIYFNFY